MSGLLIEAPNHDHHIHDHEDIAGRRNFRHDHPHDRYPNGHRHLNERSRWMIPPLVVGCLNVHHNEVDCYVAVAKGEINLNGRCEVCEVASRGP